MRVGLKPGYNVDRIDVEAGLRELTACGYHEPETRLVIEYALMRWARGEEAQAERGAIDRDFHGIAFTCWRRLSHRYRKRMLIDDSRKNMAAQRARRIEPVASDDCVSIRHCGVQAIG